MTPPPANRPPKPTTTTRPTSPPTTRPPKPTTTTRPPSLPPPADLIVGDSHTSGNSWARNLGPNCRPAVWDRYGIAVFVDAIGGPQVSGRVEEIVATRPGGHVVIMLGTNDALMSQPAPTRADLDGVSGGLIAAGAVSVRWATIPPLGNDKTVLQRRLIDEWNLAILQTTNAIDLRGALGPTLDAHEQIGDGVHLSPEGQRALAQAASRTSIC
ncbi:MAG: SGNH/GDSL hydrolase family protein [Microthrixaceae bacterium]